MTVVLYIFQISIFFLFIPTFSFLPLGYQRSSVISQTPIPFYPVLFWKPALSFFSQSHFPCTCLGDSKWTTRPKKQESGHSTDAVYRSFARRSSHRSFLFNKELPRKQGCFLLPAALPSVGATFLELAECCKEGSKVIQWHQEKVSK